VQTEATRYWLGKPFDAAKTVLSEDARLMIVAFVLTQVSDHC